MRFPPRLSSRQMWWVGIAVVVVALILTQVVDAQLSGLYGSEPSAGFIIRVLPYLRVLLVLLQVVGAGLAAGSFLVRHLENRDPARTGSGTRLGGEVPGNRS